MNLVNNRINLWIKWFSEKKIFNGSWQSHMNWYINTFMGTIGLDDQAVEEMNSTKHWEWRRKFNN